MENIQERSIQEIRGSYIIYLPKEWCINNNLKKGSRVRVKYSGSKLTLEAPHITKEEKMVVIYLDKLYKESIHYILISLYLLGIERIKIVSKRSINLKDRRDIRRIIKLYTKYGISYEGKNFIELRSEYSVQDIWQLIFKAFNTLESILNHYLEILTGKGAFEYEDVEEIEAMDSEMDFLRRDLERLHSRSLMKEEEKLDLKSQDIVVRMAIILERMVDHLNSIAKLGYEGHADLVTLPDYLAKLKSMINYLMDILYVIRDAYLYGKEIAEFNRIIKTLVNIIREKIIFHSVLKKDIVIDLIKYHMLRLYDYLTDITELIIDWVVKLYYVDYNHMLHID